MIAVANDSTYVHAATGYVRNPAYVDVGGDLVLLHYAETYIFPKLVMLSNLLRPLFPRLGKPEDTGHREAGALAGDTTGALEGTWHMLKSSFTGLPLPLHDFMAAFGHWFERLLMIAHQDTNGVSMPLAEIMRG